MQQLLHRSAKSREIASPMRLGLRLRIRLRILPILRRRERGPDENHTANVCGSGIRAVRLVLPSAVSAAGTRQHGCCEHEHRDGDTCSGDAERGCGYDDGTDADAERAGHEPGAAEYEYGAGGD